MSSIAVSVTRHDRSTRLAADCHSPPRPLRNRLGTLAQRVDVLLIKQLQVQRLANATGKYLLGGTQYDVSQSIVLTRVRQDVSAGAWLALSGYCTFSSQWRKRTFFMVGNVDSRDWHRIARKCAWTGGLSGVSGQKQVHPKASASRSGC